MGRGSSPFVRNPRKNIPAAKRLQAHMHLAQFAKLVAPLRLPSVPTAELHTAMTALVEAEVAWPTETKKGLFQRRVAELMPRILEGSDSDLRAFVVVCRPWRSEDDDGVFDPFNPKLVDLDGSLAERLAAATKYIMRELLFDLLMEGEERAALALKVCAVFLESFGEGMPESVDDDVEQWMCEALMCWRAFQTLLRPDLIDLSVEADFQAIKARSVKEKSILGMAKEVFVSHEFYKEKLKLWELSAPNLKVFGKKLTKHMRDVQKSPPAATLEGIAWCKSLLADLREFRVKLRRGSCDEFELCLSRAVADLSKVVLDMSGNHTLVHPLEAVLTDASEVFPQNAALREALEQARTVLKSVDHGERLSKVKELLAGIAGMASDTKDLRDYLGAADIMTVARNVEACAGLHFKVSGEFDANLWSFMSASCDSSPRHLGTTQRWQIVWGSCPASRRSSCTSRWTASSLTSRSWGSGRICASCVRHGWRWARTSRHESRPTRTCNSSRASLPRPSSLMA